MQSFATRGLPAAEKLSYWRNVTSDNFALMTVESDDVIRFDATLYRERIGLLTLMEVFCAAIRVRHTREHISQMSAPSYLLLTPLEREFELTLEHSASIRVRAGDFCLVDHARPYQLVHGDGVRTLFLDIPRPKMEEQVPGVEHVVGRLMTPDTTMARVLVEFLRGVGREITIHQAAALPAVLEQSLLDFVAATYAPRDEAPVMRGARAQAKAYRFYIDSRLSDPELKPAHIASQFGVSERYMRAVLSADGESFSAYVLRRRLARCARLLKDAAWDDRTITEISFRSGFNNATHFGQAFKAKYGLSPREFRSSRTSLSPVP